MPRLGSKKSRTGCTQCKARRVKCDESRPCGACIRYRVECSLLSEAVYARASSQAPSSSLGSEDSGNAPVGPHGPSASPDPLGHSALDYRSSATPEEATTGQWMQDLELMHHFTAHAHLTTPGDERTKQIWGFAVPQEAFNYPFLMHSILAFSANHLAYINPSKATHFRILSSTHQAAAVTGLNKALADMGPSSCHAVFVGGSLTVMNAFADARTYSLDVLIETFQLIRGTEYVLTKAIPMIEQGPFAAIVRPTLDPPKPSPLLSSFLVELQASCSPSPSHDPTPTDTACVKATEVLRHSLQQALETSPHPAMRAAMIWPIMIESEFIEVLKTRTESRVRAIFKQYCQLLEYASTEFWFFDGWRGISQQL